VRFPASACALGIAVACVGSRAPRPVQPPGSHDVSNVTPTAGTQGVIYLAGNDPGAVLSLREDNGRVHRLTGPMEDELRRLTGARVSVEGQADSTAYQPSIQAIGYQILEIDGHRPWVGQLHGGPGGLWLLTPDSIALDEPTGRLETLAGSKVWVVADTASRPALVQSFGLIH